MTGKTLSTLRSKTQNASASPPYILIIDDELGMCVAVRNLLELYQYKVDYALSAEEGMSYLKDHAKVDIVLLDINLSSSFNGIEVLSLIKSQHKYVQVIMLTSMNSLESGLECMKRGAFDYVTKPFNEAEFLVKLPLAIEKKRVEQVNDLYLDILVHDLKTPLQNVLGTLEYLKYSGRKNLTLQQQKMLQTGEKGIGQIRIMIDNILSISKFEKGYLSLRYERIALHTICDYLREMFELELHQQHDKLQFQNDCSDGFFFVSDRDLLQRVIVNIISNALRFTPEKEPISICFKEYSEDMVLVTITNSGSYIDHGMQDIIFDKFSRMHHDRKKVNAQNFGLGLTFSKMAVEALGGRIWIESKQEPLQTAFFFTVDLNKGKSL